jgi:hypothetical protein
MGAETIMLDENYSEQIRIQWQNIFRGSVNKPAPCCARSLGYLLVSAPWFGRTTGEWANRFKMPNCSSPILVDKRVRQYFHHREHQSLPANESPNPATKSSR